MANPYGPAARKMMIARMLMANANQPIQSPWNAISNLANTYMGWKMAGQAGDLQKARKLDKQNKLQQAIRARRGWTNPDDTYYQLTEPMRYYHDFVTKSPRGPDALEHSLTRDQWDKKQAEWVAHDRNRRNFPTGSVSEYAKLRPEPLPLSRQPGARLMRSPKGPMVPGSRQAMADVLMGSGHEDLVTMGMKLDPAFRDPLTSRPGTAIQYNEYLSKLTQRFPPQNVNGKLVDHPNVAQFKRIMKIGQPKLFNLPQGVVSVPTVGDGESQIVSPAELAPKDRPENIEAAKKAELRIKGIVKRTEGRLDEGRAAAEMLPVIRRSIALLEDIPTGGMDKFKMRVKTFFGVESADEGELAQNLGKAVLSQLRKTFGAAFTEREGDRLAEIEAGFGKSPKANMRQLRNLLAFNEEFFRQGLVAAEDLDDQAALKSMRGLNSVQLGLDEGLPEIKQPLIQPQVAPSPDDDAAQAWLKANPNHPRANDVRDRLGIPRVEGQ